MCQISPESVEFYIIRDQNILVFFCDLQCTHALTLKFIISTTQNRTNFGNDVVRWHRVPRECVCSDMSFARSPGQSFVALVTNTHQHPQDEKEPTQKPYSHSSFADTAHGHCALQQWPQQQPQIYYTKYILKYLKRYACYVLLLLEYLFTFIRAALSGCADAEMLLRKSSLTKYTRGGRQFIAAVHLIQFNWKKIKIYINHIFWKLHFLRNLNGHVYNLKCIIIQCKKEFTQLRIIIMLLKHAYNSIKSVTKQLKLQATRECKPPPRLTIPLNYGTSL